MKTLVNGLIEDQQIRSVIEDLDLERGEQLLSGLSGSARSTFMAAVYEQHKRPLMIVTPNLLSAQKLYDDLAQSVAEESLYMYPANELIAAEMSIASPELLAQRLEAMNHLAVSGRGVYIVPMAGLRKIVPPKDQWVNHQFTLSIGHDIDVDQTLSALIKMGYQRADMVSSPGEFSMRGGILDIYPLTSDPVRVELFDTEVDSIRTFSAEDQRSIETLQEVAIGPAGEMIMEAPMLEKIAAELRKRLKDSLKRVKSKAVKETMAEQTEYDIHLLENGRKPDQLFKYQSLAYSKAASLIDYLPEDGIVMFDEISRIFEMDETLENEEADWTVSLLEEGKMLHDIHVSHKLSELMAEKRQKVYFSLFTRKIAHMNPKKVHSFSCKPMQSFHGQMHLLKAEIDRWKKGRFTVVMLAPDGQRIDKFERVLADYDIDAVIVKEGDPLIPNAVQIVSGSLQSGFELPMNKLAVMTEEELFRQKTRKKKRRQKLSNAERIKSYSELKVGDFVVHVNHGIGKYLGIETLEINGLHKDYLNIHYKGNDQLYVPVDQIDLVQKYVGSEGKEPKLYKLGGTEWKRVKSKVQSTVADIADDLIKLYSERETAKGYAFTEDTSEQRDFEAAFPYSETEDQLRSIEEIKKDMQRDRPMDRLLCGDVGYGKTEVAIRAAFKAVMDGKQVAILVPTTILAQQHYETMIERMQDFPVNVGLMSRFRTKKQQEETMKGLASGSVDIVVGTHRLLSKQIKYRDIGLLIIDEEQRFGVTHKEKIKQLKTNIDVLTLTATPIPRTLHMSMLGVRDLSVIETPPENRFPVQTYVMEYNGALIREAIEREMARNGQVYFLYNRVEDITKKADEIASLVPDARVAVAHGQMTETELESVIFQFLEGEYDVLVTTTIIETGVDIPNVNTLIVFDADRMGLSQLYQLRGRVGRSNRVAYAYFTYRKDKVLTEVAEQRLQSIKEFTELGSGFKIAMRDLSIRGAGNLLGAQQHGFIDSVGFDLYSQMLKDAIEERKDLLPGKQQDESREKQQAVEIDLDIKQDAYIPESYIPDGHQKIEMYKKFRGLTTIDEVLELKDEMIDRFGDYPDEVHNLFQVAEIKAYGYEVGLETINQTKDEVKIELSEDGTQKIDGAKAFDITNEYKRNVGLGFENNRLRITFKIKGQKPEAWFTMIHRVLSRLPETLKESA
ncbi:transcription-repair coupling factor [Jeotgalibacillus terrae]|uniref:Transcription-repair-coupling factor n=1 Tax=Jeotgalibacillus terrae TaxID=587735 RepID=A0ABW5ZL46_9BACL|nr:transcription-repair coupling factor [Jeotgalibacillus terrae]MBM7580653.1 transcription-repair coupling factor (superfamily II helicase) [Jeotgalibacillus terrae]